jgi:hypothetical protein
VETITNKVAQSGIITIDPDDFHTEGKRIHLDLKECLWQGLVLREEDFRNWVKSLNEEDFRGAMVSVGCSAEALIPSWAWMLIAARLSGVAADAVFGTPDDLERHLTLKQITQRIRPEDFSEARVVVKGCGMHAVHPVFHTEITRLLTPVVRSLMFGEPCSTVPVYKRAAR